MHAKDPVRTHPLIIDRRLYGRRCLGCGLFVPDDEDLREAEDWRR